jgi:ferredoxin-thioredoxin reductase catalytic subunit
MKTKIVLSEDKEQVAKIRERLNANEGYCPCRISKTPDTKCMCKEFREQTESGVCHCGLYKKTITKD